MSFFTQAQELISIKKFPPPLLLDNSRLHGSMGEMMEMIYTSVK